MKQLLPLFLFMLTCLLAACADDELAGSATDQPTIEVDTLFLGTLLSDNSSKTYQLKLYNRCSAELRISSICLRHAPNSGYRMNVDGMNGTSFTNSDLLRIAKGDSMFIFVEATFQTEGIHLSQHTDYIDIMCNGRLQSIVLDAQCKEVEKHHGLIITADTTWSQGTELQIYDSLVIAPGVTLCIADSSTLYLHDKTDIHVYGTLICQGKLGAPVTIRGDRMDKMFDNLPYDNLPSQWGSLYIDSTASQCQFVHTDIHGMSKGIQVKKAEVLFDACCLKDSDGALLSCQMAEVSLRNCELSQAAGALFEAFGGWYDLTHCTLANYNFSAVPNMPAVHLSNFADYTTPLYHCQFLNTMVYGRWHDPDVQLDYTPPTDSYDANGQYLGTQDSIFCYRFDHCLLRATGGTDDNDFIKTIWTEDPLFRLIDTPNYSFDFRLQEDSKAIGAGSPEGTQICPQDLEGNPRPETPSIGCYETNYKP